MKIDKREALKKVLGALSSKFLFNKMTQNGPKWILNITLKSVNFILFPPPHQKNSEKFQTYF